MTAGAADVLADLWLASARGGAERFGGADGRGGEAEGRGGEAEGRGGEAEERGGEHERVRFTGPTQALPSVYEVTAAAAASIGAATLAASEVGVSRGGSSEPITIDRRHAAIAFRSERYVRVDGRPPESPWAPLSGYYRTADGWVQLHCNFDHHRDAALRALGLPPGASTSREAVAGVVAGTFAVDVEDWVVEAGGCASALRSVDEWRAHPQGRAVPSAPLVRIDRIGDAPPEPLPRLAGGARPLDGVRVLDLTRVIAGPVCGRTLAAHGASVLRIGAPHLPIIPTLAIDTGFGKRSAHLDLRSGDDVATLAGLVGDADVFVQGYRPGAVARLGFGPEALTGLRPGIVGVSLSAWGGVGPWAGRRGFDSLVQTASGIARTGGEARGLDGPGPLPAQALDHASGYLMAFGACIALGRRTTEGGSWHVEVSLARTGAWLESLGRAGSLDVADPSVGDDPDLVATTASPFGTVTHVRPVGDLEPPPRWDLPPSPFGADPPRW